LLKQIALQILKIHTIDTAQN